MDTCLAPGCDKSRGVRGLCAAHYRVASRYVQIGKTTWAELIECGLATEKKTTCRGTGIIMQTLIEKRSQIAKEGNGR